jgi:hypothetical protein
MLGDFNMVQAMWLGQAVIKLQQKPGFNQKVEIIVQQSVYIYLLKLVLA